MKVENIFDLFGDSSTQRSSASDGGKRKNGKGQVSEKKSSVSSKKRQLRDSADCHNIRRITTSQNKLLLTIYR